MGACLAELLVAACLGYHFYRFTLGPFPMTADRVLLVVLCGLYLVYRYKGWADPKPPDRADFALLVFLVVLTLNTLAHDWRYKDYQPLSGLLFYFWMPAAVYWIARQSPLTPARLRLFRVVLAVFSLYLALLALAEIAHASALIFPRYILTTKVADWGWRAQGPFLSPPTNGLYLGMALCVWMMFWPRAGRLARAGILAAMALVFCGVYLTLTRACWMGAALGVWVVVLLALPPRRRLALVTCSVLAGAVALPIAGGKLVGFKRGPHESARITALSAELRPTIAALEWDVFKDHALFGCGYGNYLKVNAEYVRSTQSDLPLDSAKGYSHHNMFLAILTETGVTGFACYLAVLGLWSYNAFRLWRRRDLPLEARQQGLVFLGYMANLAVLGLFHNANVDLCIALLTFLTAGVTQGTLAAARRSAVAPQPAAAPLRHPAAA